MKSNNRVRGFYKIETFKATQSEAGLREIPGSRVCHAEFENLITDLGLDQLGTKSPHNCTSNCYVGSGSTTPTVNDTDMSAYKAIHNTLQSSARSAQASTDPWYLSLQKVYRFDQGDAAGNLSEVGVGWANTSSGNLFSRALIQDADGNPSSITVLSDEYLDVTYELRIYPELDDVTGVVTIGGVDYDYIARPCRVSTAGSSAWDFDRSGNSGVYAYAYAGDIGDVTGLPTGTSVSGSTADGGYSAGSFQASGQYSWGLNQANFGGVRSIAANTGWARWQVQFAAVSDGSAIPKDSETVLTITLSHSWARG
ncbi:hypothetical protein QT397_06620 [Microbulbifer sp. MKSA007]|nr:hypothetical protein QT397_06620 [Microbulbifer sp. MKSA007]